jgi:UDP-N-acetylmuramoyl-L-alanyl-D-glutamate--2,6-diaminopimelate ligase
MNAKQIVKKVLPKKIWNLRHLYLAYCGAKKYNFPSEELFVIGVTGTTGKSSTIDFLRQSLESVGFRVGSLSTVDFYVAGKQKLNDQKMTMLGLAQIQQYLRKMVKAKCDIAIVETTSEGFLQYRHKYINYDMMMLTNLYPEHIESHGSFKKYKQAKLGIFDYVAGLQRKNSPKLQEFFCGDNHVSKVAIVNGNNEHATDFLQASFDKRYVFLRDDKKTYVKKSSPMQFIGADKIKIEKQGLVFHVQDHVFEVPLYGEFNVHNILSVISILRILQIDWPDIQKVLKKLKGVPGRVEFIEEAKPHGFDVIVDYAFEPIAIEALYNIVALLKPKRIIHVLGSTGGGRDIERRFSVGTFVGERANIVIVTDEDPYHDDPMEIIQDVASAVEKTGKTKDKNIFIEIDRQKAINLAMNMAKKGDIVLVTGKGSEQGMVVGDTIVSWDDRNAVRKSIAMI